QPQGLGHLEDAAEHENMKAVLRTSLGASDKEGGGVPGLRTRTRSRPGRGGRADPNPRRTVVLAVKEPRFYSDVF
ncbi:unnamed protein product, partial [Tetraodon nigroviridis]